MLYALDDHPLLQPRGEMDTAAYVALATHPTSLPFFVSPLYLYFLRAVGVSLLAARVVQILLGSVAVVLVFDTARRWIAGPRAADVSASLAILTGVVTFYEVTILQAALDPFLVALTLWLLTIALHDRRASAFAGAGFALGLFVLNRPNALLWLPVLAAAVLVRRGWRAALVLLVAFALPIAPVTIRNYVVSHELVLIASHGGLNFYIGNNPEADGTYHHVEGVRPTIAGQEEDARRVAAAAMRKPDVTAEEASSFFYRQAWSWIRSNPGTAVTLFLRKIAYTFNQTDLALNYSYSYFTRDVASPLRFLIIGPWLLFPLGLAGAVRLMSEQRAASGEQVSAMLARRSPSPRASGERVAEGRVRGFAIWAAFIPVYALAVALFFVSSRYRLPLLIPMCVTTAVMFTRPLRVWQWTLAALIAVPVCWNFGLDDGRAHERTNMIVYLAEQRRFDEAMRLVDGTSVIARDPGTLYVRSAEAVAAAGNADDALQIVRRADPAQLAPAQAKQLAQLARNFAATAVRSGENEKALAAFAAAHRLDPSEASDLLNAAVIQAQQGDFEAARANAAAALRLRPGYPQALGLLQAIEDHR